MNNIISLPTYNDIIKTRYAYWNSPGRMQPVPFDNVSDHPCRQADLIWPDKPSTLLSASICTVFICATAMSLQASESDTASGGNDVDWHSFCGKSNLFYDDR